MTMSATFLAVSSWIDGNRDFSIPRLVGTRLHAGQSRRELRSGCALQRLRPYQQLLDRHYENPTGFLQPSIGLFAGIRAVSVLSASAQSRKRLNSDSGRQRITNMMGRQKPGRYTTSRRRSIACTMPRAMRAGFAQSRPLFGISRVIGVSTKPGLTVMTCTPHFWSRCRRPERNALTSAFALPYT